MRKIALTIMALLAVVSPSCFAQEWHLSVAGGPSMSFLNSDLLNADKPGFGWNAGVQVRRYTKKGFEYGAGISLQSLVSVSKMVYVDINANPVETADVKMHYADPAIMGFLFGGHQWKGKKQNLAAGISLGSCHVFDNSPQNGGAFDYYSRGGTGIVAGLYGRYEHAISKRLYFTLALWSEYVYVHSAVYKSNFYGISLPLSLGLTLQL